jgi:hypothetical protein
MNADQGMGAGTLKSTPIWDDLGCGGMNGEGVGRQEIAKIDNENRTSPQINADIRRSGMESIGLMTDRA